MKVKELINVTFDKVTIYKVNDDSFEDIYNGNTASIPSDILEMDVRIIGASKRRVIDIQV